MYFNRMRFTLVCALGSGLLFSSLSFGQSIPTAVATRGDLEMEVNLAGVLVADDKDEIRFEPENYEGELILTRILAEGVAVKKGDVLIEFDTANIDEALEEAQNEAADVEVELKKAEAELQTATIDLDANQRQTGKELATLQREVEAAKQQQLLTLAKNQKDIVDAKHRHRDRLVDLDTLKKIYQERGLKTSTSGDILLEREQIQVENSQKSITLLEKELEYFKQFDQSKTQLEKELAVDKKLAEIEKQKIMLAAEVVEKQGVVDRVQRKLGVAQRKLDGLTQDRSQLSIVSPRDGIVFYGETGKELPAGMIVSSSMPDIRKQLRIGGRVKTHQTLMTIAEMANLTIKMQVQENDIAHIKSDMPIAIFPAAFPKLEIGGKLTQVDQVATRAGFVSDERHFNVLGQFNQPVPELRSGMNCRVRVKPVVATDAIQVPVEAVFERGGEFFCYVKPEGASAESNSSPESRPVTIGLCNRDNVQVLTGIQPGEHVYLKNPHSSQFP